ncbi:hypothetical protein FALBO_13064 [Fusarium albosuccineum]|uniref:Uncharacterized protein n=1 Tax=Fusarium albosuccineum TaxID=1237068 RepID=A0A8H4L1Z3_9HYPO|nr:hypothetical protein FALBO_13064 [Fusarium albosuccineum]
MPATPTKASQCCKPLRVRLWNKSQSRWLENEIQPTTIHQTPPKLQAVPCGDSHAIVIFANADLVRECPSCRRYFTREFRMPELWWTIYSRNSNGYFGSETFRDEEGSITAVTTWSRYLVKELDPKTGDHRWHMFNVFTTWDASTHQTILLNFHSDKQMLLTESIKGSLQDELSLLDGSQQDNHHDPFWVHLRLLEKLARLQDETVWAVRTLIRDVEKLIFPTKPEPKYRYLHDLARHAIHVSETLDVSVKTVASIIQHHSAFEEEFEPDDRRKRAGLRHVRERLLWYEHILQSLRCRASSNKERLLNEIQLAFNSVAQYDSKVSVQIGQATQSDSAAMKTIAFATLTFLPATFISAVFSMSFFNVDDNTGEWGVSRKFWIYWVIAIPVTIITAGSWYLRQQSSQPVRIGEDGPPTNKVIELQSLFKNKLSRGDSPV